MDIIRTLLIVVEVLVGLLLIGVILLQQSKSQGMGLAFGGGMGETLFGSRAGNVLTRITIILAIVFLGNTLVLGILFTASSGEKSLVEQAGAPASAPLPITAPSGPITPAAAPQGTSMTFDDAPAAPVAPVTTMDMEPEPTAVTIDPVVEAAAPMVEESAAPVIEAAPVEPVAP
jgi:preprotein translocase subunit SecG